MSVYDRVLPSAFTHAVILDRAHVPRLVDLLVSPDARHVNGSSFAVTVDEAPPNVKVWLSAASFQRVLSDPTFGPSLRRLSCD